MFQHPHSSCREGSDSWLLYRIFFLLIGFALAPTQGHAQATQGAIIGTVKDSGGAVVPNANVTLTNADEGTVRSIKSNSVGDYRFLDVKAGHYTIGVEASGFEKWTASGVVLEVRQELRVDASLTVGADSAIGSGHGRLTVSAIETDSPTISGTFTTDDADNLPVNTRASFSGTSAANIFSAVPGVQADGGGRKSSAILAAGRSAFRSRRHGRRRNLQERDRRQFHLRLFPIHRIHLRDSRRWRDGQRRVRQSRTDCRHHQGRERTRCMASGLPGTTRSSAFDAIAYTFPTTATKPSVHGNTFGGSIGGPVKFFPISTTGITRASSSVRTKAGAIPHRPLCLKKCPAR